MSTAESRPVASSAKSSQNEWRIREATINDVQAVAAGVSSLLEELGGIPPGRPAMEAVTGTVITDPTLGCVLVGETGQAIVGVLAASWQTAIHAAGRYCLIQDLWVAPAWRQSRLGASLIEALLDRCEGEVRRVEVGLPSHRFAGLRRTEAFYVRNRFAPVGLRMRRTLR